MAVFRYKMQNILNIKEKLENQEKQNFALMRARLSEEEEKLEKLKLRREEIALEAKKMRMDGINVLKIKENSALAEYIDGEIKSQMVRVTTAQKNLDSAAKKMQKAIQERKIQEKLKEKAYDEYLIEENLAEAKEIDQLTSYTYGQKIKEQ